MLRDRNATFTSPAQYHVYKKLLERQTHLVSISGTGSGKTLPFQLAILSWPPETRAVMVLPYQVLHNDMKRRFNGIGISCGKWHSGNHNPTERVITLSIESFSSQACIGWLNDLANSGKLGAIMYDEAHGLVEDSTFRDAYDCSITKLMQLQNCPILFCSATLPPQYMHAFWNVLKAEFRPQDTVQVIRSPTQRHNICYQVLDCKVGHPPPRTAYKFDEWQEKWVTVTIKFIRVIASFLNVGKGERGVVFFGSDEDCRLWAGHLQCPYIIGDVDVEQRVEGFRKWREGQTALICLNKAGFYGFDYPSIRFAIMVGAPWSMTEFMQSSGRIGRDGEFSSCITLLPSAAKKPFPQAEESFSGKKAIGLMLHASGECLRYFQSHHMDGNPVTCSDLQRTMERRVAPCSACFPKLHLNEDEDEDGDLEFWAEPWGKFAYPSYGYLT
ncbi:P-loop containing nucleoside triphosphate hydrolase protein [Cantharellus anzutake]|uniref:P-loop containing nucleoside triphosphate hydrolase protein n=1 Tax=Cantharellus anzutake TaxID=1750568 RepID=UPI001905AA3A|nr:P-loop containing nucleoside triphosphate hydrolase protein [Cantharellus anzutake]XP_038910883.1 P-loop containing nucleoside triphosphate hydrolase protein [Cantharellus anzutake]KAF8319906.1 P-loop containing nucleoside triphosphate hydrolase protein [Cantharellus anzutake]KAF8322404.1 P-loop containing nucleoside triphosphate hydrolase protein [Cantharellus anzutake]